ncbi:MAG TPA: prolipoprotein diacylglyceryl transferase family protein [Acidobacteriaceae bacterium]|nr:prolipoprotein diacylglyceryl transferase family protein [Acidobacteriaceae bacterium]
MHPLLLHTGTLAIPTYGVLTAAALLAALALCVPRARQAGLPADKLWNLGLVAILTALSAARLLVVATNMREFARHPFWVLGLATVDSGWIAVGGAAVGGAAAALYALAEGLPLLRVADVAAPAAALGFAINRVGAFCAGLAWGTPTTLPWGVTYRSAVAWLWYRTPLGTRLQPVQLYDAAASLAILALLMWMPRQREGETAGTWLFLYGVCRFFLEFLRGDAVREPTLGSIFTLAQGLAVLAVIAGGALWLRREAKPAS